MTAGCPSESEGRALVSAAPWWFDLDMNDAAGWSTSDLVILLPYLGRPHTVAPLLDSIAETVPGASVMACLTPGDTKVSEAFDNHPYPTQRLYVDYQPVGDYARKVNAGYRATTQPLIFTGACDLEFHPNWFEAATAMINANSRIGIVGTNDLGNPRVLRGEHSTHSLITRHYADTYGLAGPTPGAIYCELYPHECCDDELWQTGLARGAAVSCARSVVKHLHPNWGLAPTDALYSRQAARTIAGRKLLTRRQHLWLAERPADWEQAERNQAERDQAKRELHHG